MYKRNFSCGCQFALRYEHELSWNSHPISLFMLYLVRMFWSFFKFKFVRLTKVLVDLYENNNYSLCLLA